jgi:hypothetical protein
MVKMTAVAVGVLLLILGALLFIKMGVEKESSHRSIRGNREATMNEFSKIFIPPVVPIDKAVKEQWPEIEYKIGTPLPWDYKEYIYKYGNGRLLGSFWVLNPYSKNKHLNLFPKMDFHHSRLRKERGMPELHQPNPVFPEAEGLLLFCTTDNGDSLFWKTKGTPDEWTIVVNEVRSDNYEEFPLNMTEFFSHLYRGKITTKIYSEEFLDQGELFVRENDLSY